MARRVALNHVTTYKYSRAVQLSPHIIRLRPAPHARTSILSYSIQVTPAQQFLNWQQDAYSNWLARLVFTEPADELRVEVGLVADMVAINPFDFFVEPVASEYPFSYGDALARELSPYMERLAAGPLLREWVAQQRQEHVTTIDYLVDLNRNLQKHIEYVIRLEPGVQAPEETLTKRAGSCRDTGWLLVQIMRHLGFAARFVSGYLIQLVADVPALEGPQGPTADFTDLHAWAEVYLPGAGWIGLDPTSGLLAGEGHIPLACSAEPSSAAPVDGSFTFDENEGPVETVFGFTMRVDRVFETPRVSKPFTDAQWAAIDGLGREIDEKLAALDVRLTMGGEPTFVSIDDLDGAEWNTAAVGPNKRRLSEDLVRRLRTRWAPGGALHYGQGKWYPSESLPRWSLNCFWRTDGEPVWENGDLFAAPGVDYGHDSALAERFIRAMAKRLEVHDHSQPGYEDTWYYLWKERRLPTNVDPFESNLKDAEERAHLARIFEQGLDYLVGWALPLAHNGVAWQSGQWFYRTQHMYLMPGDSPMGFRLPLDSLEWLAPQEFPHIVEADPLEARAPLPARHRQMALAGARGQGQHPTYWGQRLTDDGVVRTALCVEPRNGRLHIFFPPLRHAETWIELVAAVEEVAASLETPIVLEGYPPPHDCRLRHVSVTPDPGVIEVNTPPAASWDEAVFLNSSLYDEARLARLKAEKFLHDGRIGGTGGGGHITLGGPTPADSPLLRRPDLLGSLVSFWNNHPSLTYFFSSLFIGPTSQAPRVDEGRRDMRAELEIALQQLPQNGNAPAWLVDRVLRNILVDGTGNTHRAEFCIDKLYSPDLASGRQGLLEMRCFEMAPDARMKALEMLLVRALVAQFWERPYDRPLVPWDNAIHDRFMLPHFLAEDFRSVLGELAWAMPWAWFEPHYEFRFPQYGETVLDGVRLELRQAVEPWYVLGEEPGAGGTVRNVDSSVERVQIKAENLTETRHALLCNGRPVPLFPTGRGGEWVAGIRFRAWQPPACLHPTIGVHTPLVFDLLDRWNGRTIGGCTYHVSHPGGRAWDDSPINPNEAEGRRLSRFTPFGSSSRSVEPATPDRQRDFPLTLDLRR